MKSRSQLGRSLQRRARQTITTATLLLVFGSTPVAATHDSLKCSPPEALAPLMNLLHSLGELAFLAGVSVGTLGFLAAGIAFMLPGEEWARRGKKIVKNVFIGVVLLLSANMIVSYLISQLGGSMC